MIKIVDLLQEEKQTGVLYHYTPFNSAVDILKSDSLKSSPIRGTKDNQIHALSLTRNKNFHKSKRSLLKPLHCRFVLDGNNISNNFKIKPYVQPGFEKGTEHFESEETIESNKPFKIPLKKYLMRVDIIIKLDDLKDKDYDFDWDLYGKNYLELFKICKEKNIPINLIDKNSNVIPNKEKQSILKRVMSLFK